MVNSGSRPCLATPAQHSDALAKRGEEQELCLSELRRRLQTAAILSRVTRRRGKQNQNQKSSFSFRRVPLLFLLPCSVRGTWRCTFAQVPRLVPFPARRFQKLEASCRPGDGGQGWPSRSPARGAFPVNWSPHRAQVFFLSCLLGLTHPLLLQAALLTCSQIEFLSLGWRDSERFSFYKPRLLPL